MIEKLYAIDRALNTRFPDGNEPFQIMTRLLEEAGELAEQVNHFEGKGVKRAKHGKPDKAKLAKEVQDVLRAALHIAMYYGIESDLQWSVDKAYQHAMDEGLISQPVPANDARG